MSKTSCFFKKQCTCQMSPCEVFGWCRQAAQRAQAALGMGQQEKSYEDAMCNFLYDVGIPVKRQVSVHQIIDGHIVPTGIVDMEICKKVIIELKANYTSITHDHKVQVLRYQRSMQAETMHDGKMICAIFLFAKDGSLKEWNSLEEYAECPLRDLNP